MRKITGLNKAADVTLKRGVIGSLNLYQWLDQIRNGDAAAYRNVVIQLQNEDHSAVVMTWKLLRRGSSSTRADPSTRKGRTSRWRRSRSRTSGSNWSRWLSRGE